MILKDKTYSPAGYTWQELRVLFESLACLQNENSGMHHSFLRIVGDIHELDLSDDTFTQKNAFVYISAKASTSMMPLVASINNTVETSMHNRIYAAFSAWHMLYACTANPYPRYTTLEPLSDYLALYVGQYGANMGAYERTVLASFSKHIGDNVYKGIPELQRDVLRYLDKIRRGGHDVDFRNQAVTACCYILSLV